MPPPQKSHASDTRHDTINSHTLLTSGRPMLLPVNKPLSACLTNSSNFGFWQDKSLAISRLLQPFGQQSYRCHSTCVHDSIACLLVAGCGLASLNYHTEDAVHDIFNSNKGAGCGQMIKALLFQSLGHTDEGSILSSVREFQIPLLSPLLSQLSVKGALRAASHEVHSRSLAFHQCQVSLKWES